MDEIAARLEAVRAQYGSEALAMFIGTRTGILDYRATTKMFAQLWGTPNKDGTDPFCASGKNVAFELTQGDINLFYVMEEHNRAPSLLVLQR